jgi:hypothetical protein
MKRYQLNLLSVSIIMVVISLAFLIYYQYSMNVKKEQEEYIFENFISSLQNLQNTINSMQGVYYIKVDIPNGVILYAEGSELIIQYNNNNYTINFQNKNVTIYNNGQNVSFLYPNNYIYLVSTNNVVFVTTNTQDSVTILNECMPKGNIIYSNSANSQNSNNSNENSNSGSGEGEGGNPSSGNTNNGGSPEGGNGGGGGGSGGSSSSSGGSGGGNGGGSNLYEGNPYVSCQNNNISINFTDSCLIQYNGQSCFFWGNVNGNNYLSPPAESKFCGSCWAVTSAYITASIYMIRNNEPNLGLTLSPSYILINCNYGNPNTPPYCNYSYVQGCKGGDPYIALTFASEYGIPPDPGWEYYSSKLASCNASSGSYPGDVCNILTYDGPNSPLYHPKGVINLINNNQYLSDQQIIQDLLCYGPLIATGLMAGAGGPNPLIYPRKFVFTGESAHSMLLVGYDTQSPICLEVYGTPDCWIFENTFGSDRTGCLVFYQDGSYAVVIEPQPLDPTACYVLYSDYQACNLLLAELGINALCGGVYWIQNGFVYVPFDQSPFGLSFPMEQLLAVQNVTISQ